MSIFDNAGNNKESTHGPHQVSIQISAGGTLLGSKIENSLNGDSLFSSLRITSAGSFTISASSTDMVEASTTSFQVQNFPFSLTFVRDLNSVSCYFDYEFQVVVLGEDGNKFIGVRTVSLDQVLGMTGTSSVDTVDSVASFNVFFTTSGIKSLVAKVGAVSQTAQVEVLKLKLMVSDLDPVVREI